MGTRRTTLIAVMLISLSLLGLAWCLSPEFVERHLTPDGEINDCTRGQITLFRIALCGMVPLVPVFSMMRKPFVRDFLRTAARRRRVPDQEVLFVHTLMGCPSPRLLRIILWIALPAWLLLVEVSFYWQIAWPRLFLSEQGFQENTTVLLYLLGGTLTLRRVLRLRSRGVSVGLYRWWMFGLSVFCILVALEEANWGQVYFHFGTPELIEQVNYQGDLSLHNLRLPGPLPGRQTYWANVLCWWLAVCGALVPSLLWVSKRLRRFVWTWEIPVPPLLAQGYFAAAALVPRDDMFFGGLMLPSEMCEFSIAVAFAVWLWTEQNRHSICIASAESTCERASRLT